MIDQTAYRPKLRLRGLPIALGLGGIFAVVWLGVLGVHFLQNNIRRTINVAQWYLDNETEARRIYTADHFQTGFEELGSVKKYEIINQYQQISGVPSVVEMRVTREYGVVDETYDVHFGRLARISVGRLHIGPSPNPPQ